MKDKPIEWSTQFTRQYKERIFRNDTLRAEFWDALSVFRESRAAVRDHELEAAMTGLFAFDVAPDCRVVYLETEEKILLLKVGRHREVYIR